MKKTIIVIVVLAAVGTAAYFAWKQFQKPKAAPAKTGAAEKAKQ